jgi:hypothetical protein
MSACGYFGSNTQRAWTCLLEGTHEELLPVMCVRISKGAMQPGGLPDFSSG